MSQSLTQVYLHIVFSTKHRTPFLKDAIAREKAHGYLAGACQNLESSSIKIGGVGDHVHILCRQNRNLSVAQLIRELKRESSKWIKLLSPDLRGFSWQGGYGAFSISPSHIGALTRYIVTQEDHHRTETFQDELRRLLRKYGIEFDERYVGNDACVEPLRGT